MSVWQAKARSFGETILQNQHEVACNQTGGLFILSPFCSTTWMDDINQPHEEPLHMALCILNARSDLPMDLPSTHALEQGPS